MGGGPAWRGAAVFAFQSARSSRRLTESYRSPSDKDLIMFMPFRCVALGATAVTLLSVQGALAHATLGVTQGSPNASYRGIVQITHGCDGSPTARVKVILPEGCIGPRPMAEPGLSLSPTKGPYAKSYSYLHGTLSEGVKE